jgi:hypothetical protein
MSRTPPRSEFSFQGFSNPTTTPVPDVVFDQFLSKLGEAELKALLYIIRRTFGFKRDQDPISFNQFLRGITRRDGRVLDEGCGIRDRTTLSRALKSLEAKGIIRSAKGVDERGENETTIYSLRFKHDGPKEVVGNSYHPSGNNPPPVVGIPYLQQTGLQETVEQQTGERSLRHPSSEISPSNIRTGSTEEKVRGEERGKSQETDALEYPDRPHGFAPPAAVLTTRADRQAMPKASRYSEERQVIGSYIHDFSLELADRASPKSSATRAYHLFQASALPLERFIGLLYEARSIVKERTHAIRGGSTGTNSAPKAKMAYYFAVLEDLLGFREHPEASGPIRDENGRKFADSSAEGTNTLPARQTPAKSRPGAKSGHSGKGSATEEEDTSDDRVGDSSMKRMHDIRNWHQVGELVYDPYTRRFMRKPAASGQSPPTEEGP